MTLKRHIKTKENQGKPLYKGFRKQSRRARPLWLVGWLRWPGQAGLAGPVCSSPSGRLAGLVQSAAWPVH